MNKLAGVISKFTGSPLTRISFGLVMLTASFLFISEFIGLVPDQRSAELQARKAITEMLAVQLTNNIQNNYLEDIDETLSAVIDRNENVLSGAVKLASGEALAEYGPHQRLWSLNSKDKSTPSQIQVTLFSNGQRWGRLELRFADIDYGSSSLSFRDSYIYFVLFISIVGFIGYRLFLNRVLRELNPDAVIPERVRNALNTLSEGLLIIDNEGVIIFSNESFASKTGLRSENLVGRDSGSLDWKVNLVKGEADSLPWMRVIAGEEVPRGSRLNLSTALKEAYIFNVNVSPITTTEDEIKGALVTFDDVTEFEKKNDALREAMDRLEESQQEILQQNEELLRLATRDPLTNALNRRSLFDMFDRVFEEALETDTEVCCLMVDIDHFKSVNDTYGHAVGDEAIKFMASTLQKLSRSNDLVGRLGGEEFVVVLPDTATDAAMAIGEKMRLALEAGDKGAFPDVPNLTASFGLSTVLNDPVDAKELLNQADEALYVAKESGRNRLIFWCENMEETIAKGEAVQPAAVVNDSAVAKPVLASNDDTFMPLSESSGETNSLAQNQVIADSLTTPLRCPPEKALLLERLNQSIDRIKDYQSKIALLVVNVDALQRVNDNMGMLSAEKFAKIIIKRIKQGLHTVEADYLNEKNEATFSISRLNHNEIVVLIPDLDKSTLVTSFIYSIFSETNEPVLIEGNDFYINANIGVSIYPSHGENSEELLRNASSAMQEARHKPERNNFQFYSKEIAKKAKQKILLEAELYKAVELGQFVLYYQPRMSLSTGSILGFEALIRWQHPQLGLVSPDDFVPLAEQMGLIQEIGKWIVRSASQQVRVWREMGYDSASVSINLSPVEFRNPDLAKQIIQIVKETGIPANTVEFEITESVVMHSIDATKVILEELSTAGFSISLDDFGTGYSSLAYLKSFPVTKVKVDKSFVNNFGNDKNDAAIVSGIISMAHSLGLQVVAEGVEEEAQLRYLQDLQCDEVQGFLFGGTYASSKATSLLEDPTHIRLIIENSPLNNDEEFKRTAI